MADDELIIPIDKAFWPRGVMRGLTPVLRNLGDKYGNLVIAAVPNKHIMVKGPPNRIEEVKVPLRELIEEYFPDADVPDELGGGGGGAVEEEPAPPPPAPKPEPRKAEPKPQPTKEAPQPVVTESRKAAEPAAAAPANQQVSRPKRKIPTPAKPVAEYQSAAPRAPSDLLWECVKSNHAFLRKPAVGFKSRFSAEPGNLLGMHIQKFSGLCTHEVLDVRPSKVGEKEKIELVRSAADVTKCKRVVLGLSKCPEKGLAQLDRDLYFKGYRKNDHELACLKYQKVHQTFKKRASTKTKSRKKKEE